MGVSHGIGDFIRKSYIGSQSIKNGIDNRNSYVKVKIPNSFHFMKTHSILLFVLTVLPEMYLHLHLKSIQDQNVMAF